VVASVDGNYDFNLGVSDPAAQSILTGERVIFNGTTWSVMSNTTHATPIGTIIMFASFDTIPAGYLRCDGAAYNTATYPQLFILTGQSFTPNLTEHFIKGASNQGQVTAYTQQADSTARPNTTFTVAGSTNTTGNHTHRHGDIIYNYGGGGGRMLDPISDTDNTAAAGNHSHTLSGATVNGGGDAITQPPHVYMAYYIKSNH